MPARATELRYFERERMEWIKNRIETMGRVNRREIRNAFDVSQATASKDLQTFQLMHPGMIVYDVHRKHYRKVEALS
jgi:hypothetical protein